MRVTGDWLTSDDTQAVLRALTDAGYQAYAVGGCVRNALLGAPIADVDIASDAVPEQVIAAAKAAGLKPVPTGIDHGTVTVVCNGIPHEVTTFRKDVETHGRHATVLFAKTLREDAERRDFTMNALYVDADGVLVDPLGGIDDLKAGRVRFIGDPHARIFEDFLRILRFYRFHAWYGNPAAGLDAEGQAACAAHIDGLARLSRERVGAEMRKLLAAPDPAPSVAAMAQSGVLAALLPGADPKALAPLVHIEKSMEIAPRWQRRLVAIGGSPDSDLRMSRADQRAIAGICAALASDETVKTQAYRLGADAALDAALIVAATLGQMPDATVLSDTAKGAAAVFPLKARDLLGRFEPGPKLGAELRRLENSWIASDFSLEKAALLEM